MVGITLSPEQIRAAPPEVRRWIEQEVLHMLRLGPEIERESAADAARQAPPHIIACTAEDAAHILTVIRQAPSAVAVYLELGRDPGIGGQNGMRVLRLADLQRHARLPDMRQLLEALHGITAAFNGLSHEPGAMLFGIDERGICIISEQTQHSIALLWHKLLGLTPPDGHPETPTHAASGHQERPAEYSLHASFPTPGRPVHMPAPQEPIAPAHPDHA